MPADPDVTALDGASVLTARGRAVTFGSAETIDPGRPADPARVAEEVQIVMQAFIPYDTVPATTYEIEPGITAPLPVIDEVHVHGDAASHTRPGQDDSYLDDQGFRTQQIVTLQFDEAGNQIGYRDVIKRVGESLGYEDAEGTRVRSRATVSPDSLSQTITEPSVDGRPGSVTVIQFDNETSIPSEVVKIAPGITNDTRVTVTREGGQAAPLTVQVSGEHDRFPAYEVVVRRISDEGSTGWTLVHGSHPEEYGDGEFGIGPLRGLGLPSVPVEEPPVRVSPPG